MKDVGRFVLIESINMAFELFEAHQELKEKENDLSITLNSIGDAVIATDIEGNITPMNPVAEQITGLNIDDVKGKQISEVINIFYSKTNNRWEDPVKKF